MSYDNNDFKFACVVNRTVALPRLMNALAHTVAGLAGDLTRETISLLDYENATDGFTARISQWPVIILQAKNSSQLSTLRSAADEKLIAHNVFTSSMIGQSAEDQMAQTMAASGADLEYWVVALFGASEVLNPLTKKFSLFSNVVSKEAEHAV